MSTLPCAFEPSSVEPRPGRWLDRCELRQKARELNADLITQMTNVSAHRVYGAADLP